MKKVKKQRSPKWLKEHRKATEDLWKRQEPFIRIKQTQCYISAVMETLLEDKMINEEQLKAGIEKLDKLVGKKLRIMKKKVVCDNFEKRIKAIVKETVYNEIL